MISPLASGLPSPLRNAAPPRQDRPDVTEPRDQFIALETDNLSAAEAPPAPLAGLGKHLVRKAVFTACLTTTGVAGLLAGIPTAAAAQLQHGGLVPSKDPAVRQLVASSLVTGKIPPGTVAERLAQLKPEVRTLLNTLPPETQKSYVDLDVGARKWMSGRVNGRTDTIFGKVKNRKAFVSGHFFVVNIFGQLKDQIAGEVKKGTIPREAQPRINAAIESLNQLKPDQRETLARALETEFKA
ncbi:MAG: hypothetical protein KF760_20395 [Candidatus Eremiobacteraeota bacterium]|nr:hypothetical protein [Candidatus Eremiobacteraeota bacterium]MCW5871768.1 hypothetical protein [Candidatus Eremiobacteraeota bacterium]